MHDTYFLVIDPKSSYHKKVGQVLSFRGGKYELRIQLSEYRFTSWFFSIDQILKW